MRFLDVYRVSDNLETSAIAEVDALAAALGTDLPTGYREFVSMLGLGDYSGYVRVYSPSRIRDELAEFRERRGQYFLWEPGEAVLPRERVVESIIVADTIDGDEVSFHPLDPQRLNVLSCHDEAIYLAGRDLDEALAWLCDSGILVQSVGFHHFESWKDRLTLRGIGQRSPHEAVRDLLALGTHDHVVSYSLDEEGWTQFFYREFFRWVNLYDFGDGSMEGVVRHDVHRRTDLFDPITELLHRHGCDL